MNRDIWSTLAFKQDLRMRGPRICTLKLVFEMYVISTEYNVRESKPGGRPNSPVKRRIRDASRGEKDDEPKGQMILGRQGDVWLTETIPSCHLGAASPFWLAGWLAGGPVFLLLSPGCQSPGLARTHARAS
jgi:hypothetical protein